jgi:hypothetical protein
MTGVELLTAGYQVIRTSATTATAINEGAYYKVIGALQSFSSYEEAETYVSNQGTGNYAIGGFNDPFTSPVFLDELHSYEHVYSSGDTTSSTTVKIFKYLGSDES